MPDLEHRAIPIRNGQFVADVVEAGAGRPVLYLHGEWGRTWDGALDRLAAARRIIAPCHPGYGDSTGTEHLLDLHDLIYYYLDFLDALGLRHLPLVGSGLGGMIAAELAAVQPDRFSRLILIAPLGLWNPAYPVLDFFAADPSDLAKALFHDPESPAGRAAADVPTQGEPYVEYMLDRAKSMATSAKYLWPIPNRGLSKRLHRITMPTLLVWGASDGVCPIRYADDFRVAIPGSEVVLIDNAGHCPLQERPDELARVISTFLDAQSGEAGGRTTVQ